ncbi:glucose-1-phosphate cytidylyltransferase [Anaeroplasma bactoclasticum]|jgi:glucose-1-phosphate cytidylyltransferase|uniref:Glucose-1-phosphate cytidylyltransferase n=1 Tax=Anaeroplasma bactoclasticum TaxID=2088 RepID=A0A397S1Z2_9MOLU|nr:glucose-1-phosphate cytidylyltransferase [Anaeroplasma bactoclasticum]RIA78415.1 glucose-1-phosphate cytidylyltransferase [Anaeroplasma bactoclasticum]
MKVVILAGGLGTRISEESYLKPKPMIEIGNYPILVHIMRIYATNGFNDFVVCAGYKQQVIKEYFAHFNMYTNDVQFDFATGDRHLFNAPKFDWKVTVVDTGNNTQTGGRILRASKYLNDEPFLLTYGDAVGDVDINAVIECHKKSGKLATITVYNFGQSKGVVDMKKNGQVNAFREKSDLDGDLINIGFMVIEPAVLGMIENDESILEKHVLQKLAKMGQLNAYVHKGFWQCMDTMNEKKKLEDLYISDNCPWKVWKK